MTIINRKVISDGLTAFTSEINFLIHNINLRFGCREMPSTPSVPEVCIGCLRHSKPFATICMIHIPCKNTTSIFGKHLVLTSYTTFGAAASKNFPVD